MSIQAIARAALVCLGFTLLLAIGGCRDSDQLRKEQSSAKYEMRVVDEKLGVPILEAYKNGSRPRNMTQLLSVPNVDIDRIRPISSWGKLLDITSLEFDIIEDTAEVTRIRYMVRVDIPQDPEITALEMTSSYFHDTRPVAVEYSWK